MEKLTAYRQILAEAVPDLRIESAKLHTTDGQFNDIVLINDQWIFRFPRTVHVAQQYANQALLLSALQGKLPLPIPAPYYTSAPDAAWQQCFMGYRRIPGQPLYRDQLDAIRDTNAQQHMATQLADFLRSLHQLTQVDLPIQLPISDSSNDWADLYRNFQAKLFPFMRAQARQEVSKRFEDYLQNVAQYTYRPVLRHGDFGGSNVLYDPQHNRISGVIDFESLGLGDPATDVAALAEYGEYFFALCLHNYPEMESMRDRASFYRSTFALQEAYYGLRDGDREAFRRGIAQYV